MKYCKMEKRIIKYLDMKEINIVSSDLKKENYFFE